MRKFELLSKMRAIWEEKVMSFLDRFVQFGKIMETAKLLGTCSFDLGRKEKLWFVLGNNDEFGFDYVWVKFCFYLCNFLKIGGI
jgi:hypothetical protein